jgi:hypothetical protein
VGLLKGQTTGADPMTTATLNRYTLNWEAYSTWPPADDDIGGIYTDCVHFYAVGGYKFEVSFRIGEGRQQGLLFCEVVMVYPNRIDTNKLHYCMGQFYKNSGAKLFAQFALNHFIETETWSVCPSFQPVDYIDGEPCTLGGDEIVSEII